jgi:hypothetical protein
MLYRGVVYKGPKLEPALELKWHDYETITVCLPIAIFRAEDGREYAALKSEETPIETLRLMPGFVENNPAG